MMRAFFKSLLPTKATPIVPETHDVDEWSECFACGESYRTYDDEGNLNGVDEIVDVTYVDHMVVSEDREFICRDCMDRRDDAAIDAYEAKMEYYEDLYYYEK